MGQRHHNPVNPRKTKQSKVYAVSPFGSTAADGIQPAVNGGSYETSLEKRINSVNGNGMAEKRVPRFDELNDTGALAETGNDSWGRKSRPATAKRSRLKLVGGKLPEVPLAEAKDWKAADILRWFGMNVLVAFKHSLVVNEYKVEYAKINNVLADVNGQYKVLHHTVNPAGIKLFLDFVFANHERCFKGASPGIGFVFRWDFFKQWYDRALDEAGQFDQRTKAEREADEKRYQMSDQFSERPEDCDPNEVVMVGVHECRRGDEKHLRALQDRRGEVESQVRRGLARFPTPFIESYLVPLAAEWGVEIPEGISVLNEDEATALHEQEMAEVATSTLVRRR